MMGGVGGADGYDGPELAARRAARRAAARAHHPDLGGDPEEFIRALAVAAATPQEPRYDVRPSSRLRLARRAVRRTARAARGRLPRVVPGSTRYIGL